MFIFVYISWLILHINSNCIFMKVYLASYFQKWIEGYTGDCLGAKQQINEIVTLLFCLAIWKFI